MGFIDRLEKFRITHRQIAIMDGSLALITIFLMVPIPMIIGPITMDFYNEIQKLPPGSVIAWAQNCAFGTYMTKKDGYRAVVYSIFDRGLKLILYSFDPDAPQLNAAVMAYCNVEKKYGAKYGVDYVIFPFLAGEETAMAAVATDTRVLKTDLFGNDIESLPLMKNVRSMRDIPLTIMDAGSFTFAEMWARQWPAKYGNRALNAYIFATTAAVYGVYVHGCLDGVRGYAEYEKLTGYLGDHLIKMNARNLQGLAVFIVVGLGNISWAIAKYRKREVKVRPLG